MAKQQTVVRKKEPPPSKRSKRTSPEPSIKEKKPRARKKGPYIEADIDIDASALDDLASFCALSLTNAYIKRLNEKAQPENGGNNDDVLY